MDPSLRIQAHAARAAIAAGARRGAPLVELLTAIAVFDRDEWVDVALGIEEAPCDEPGLPRGAVPYLPCGIEEILAMVREGKVARLFHEPAGRRSQSRKKLPHLPDGEAPESLVPVVLKAMHVLREARYATVKVLQAEVAAYQNGFATSVAGGADIAQMIVAADRHHGGGPGKARQAACGHQTYAACFWNSA